MANCEWLGPSLCFEPGENGQGAYVVWDEYTGMGTVLPIKKLTADELQALADHVKKRQAPGESEDNPWS